MVPSTERVFALSCFEGMRLIRVYAAKQPGCPLPELVSIIEHVEADALNLDLEASLYLHGLVDPACPLEGDAFYRRCISSVVTQHQPNWCRAMRQGRMRFLDSLEQNDRDVFTAAGLAKDPPTLGVVTWWDTVAGFARLLIDVQKMLQARAAEQLTIKYEAKRLIDLGIDKLPEWKGLDGNFAGYDVLSYDLGEFGPVSRMIEVKSTVNSPLRFVLTRNEWNRAVQFGLAYHFHLWDMATTPPVLHERTTAQVAGHIPSDNKKGKWKTVEVPIGI